MITVESQKILVSVPVEVWNSYAEEANRLYRLSGTETLPSGKVVLHDAMKIQRGLLLSDAHKKISALKDLKKINKNRNPISKEEIENVAKEIAIQEYLDDRSIYKRGEVFFRYWNDMAMSEGMLSEIDRAKKYAEEKYRYHLDEAEKGINNARWIETHHLVQKSDMDGWVIKLKNS